MADPATLATISTIATVFQTVSGLVGANREAEQAEAQGKLEQFRFQVAETQQRKEDRRRLSKISAVATASGVDPESGSAVEIALSSAREAELNAQNLRISGQLAKAGGKQRAANIRSTIPSIAFGGIGSIGKIAGSPGGQSILNTILNRKKKSPLLSPRRFREDLDFSEGL